MQEARQDRQDQRAADDHDGERLLRLRADAVRERGGQEAQHRHERRHQHRAKASLGRQARAVSTRLPSSPQPLRVGDDDQRVLDGDTRRCEMKPIAAEIEKLVIR